MRFTLPAMCAISMLTACAPSETQTESSEPDQNSALAENTMELETSVIDEIIATTEVGGTGVAAENGDTEGNIPTQVPAESGTPTEPEESGTPTEPEEPGTPTEPEEPETPAEPEEPETPAEPEEPETPAEPEEPEAPTEPEEPESPTEPTELAVTETLSIHQTRHAVKLVLPAAIDISSRPALSSNLSLITKELYESFEDEFDFIFLMSNYEVRPPSFNYAGIFFGIGSPSVYGSAGKLKGVIHFPFIRGIKYGPALHEVAHLWTDHKGFTCFSSMTTVQTSSGRGPLGGCSGDSLQPEPGSSFADGGTFTADNFGLVANGGNGVPFNGAELFEMGFISKAQAGDVWVIDNPADAVSSVPGKRAFTADKITKMTYAEYNTTDPDVAPDTFRSFRVLTVLIDNVAPSEANFTTVADDASWFSMPGDDGISGLYNFNEATNYLGTLVTGNLDVVLK